MQRINNAPPPMTPWRKEVLEAQKQAAEAARRASGGRSKSRSRSRSQNHQRKAAAAAAASAAAGSGAGGSSGSRDVKASRKKKTEEEPEGSGVAVMKDALLRQAKERGEGWYAAVARAAEVWEEEERRRKVAPPAAYKGKDKQAKDPLGKDREREKRKDKDKGDRPGEKGAPEDKTPTEHQREKLEQEKKWRQEFEAREKRVAEERKKAEDERRRKEVQEKQRKSKLSGAFAMDDDDEEEQPDRTSKLLKRAADRKSGHFVEVSIPSAAEAAKSTQLAVPAPVAGPASTGATGSELGKKLGFDGCSDPAEAFMRLQERKRKGRRAEFGGPPRGCSPWRDGKRGVSFGKERGED